MRDSYRFDLDTKQKTWKHVCFYDFETAPVAVDWKGAQGALNWLDIRNIGICAYTFAIPADLYKPVLPGTATDAGEYVYVQNYNEANREQITQEAREIVEWLAQQSKRKGKVLLIGYNSNRFDILLFVDMLRPEPYGCYRYGHTSLIFSDLLPWARSMGLYMLAQVGEFLQLPKLEHTKDYVQYNRRDVEILVQFWHWLQSQGITYLTSAGESRHRMAKELSLNLQNLKAIYTDKAISDLVEYYGGRTEAYQAQVKEAWDLDINSLYPSVMCNFQYPAIDPENGKIPMYKQPPTEGFIHAIQTQLNTALQELLEQPVITPELARNAYNKHCTFHGCLYVQLHRIKPEYRSIAKRLAFWFPFPHKQAGYTMFSFTKQPFWVEFYECLWLSFFDYDILDAVITPLWSAFPAADAVRARYNLKQEAGARSDTNTYLMQKIFLNSAYGIFGTKNRVWEPVLEEPLRSTILHCFYKEGLDSPFLWTDNHTYKVQADKVFVQNNRPDQKYAQNTVPIWAIATTSHARFVLYSYILNAVLRSELQIYYTDTDSLFVNKEFVEFLQVNNCISSTEIGKFRIKGGPSDATFLAPKTYIFGGQRHFKGTGQDWVRTIVAQSPRQQFTVYNRYALDPSQPQKRLYVASSGLFLPISKPAVSKDLPALCQSVGFTLPFSEPEFELDL